MINNDRDKYLDPEVAKYLKVVRARPPLHLVAIEQLRKDIDKLPDIYPPEPVRKIEDRLIPGADGAIPVRIYTPEHENILPLAVFYHGGGWCIGSPKGYDSVCAALANRIPAVVMSVGYRLAPEYQFPAAVDDCYAGLEYAASNARGLGTDPGRLAVIGDSAGANLAAAVCLKSKEESGPKIALEVLIYPATDLSRTDTESYRLFGEGYDLNKDLIETFRSKYIPNKKDWANPYASPELAKDLCGMPPALVITAEFDPLRDDGKIFAQKLKDAGVPVRYSLYKGMIHGFLSFTAFGAAQKAYDEIAGAFADLGTKS